MRLLIIFLRAYPLQSAITLGALIFAGLIEGVGLSMLLPLLSLAADITGGASGGVAGDAGSKLNQMVNSVFVTFGITPTIGALLIIFVVCMIIKALLTLVMNKRVGYMVAQVATDLRLDLIHALFNTRWEYFIRQPIGSLTNSIASETTAAARAYLLAMTMLAITLQAVVYGTIVFLISWEATVVALVAGIIVLFLVRRFISKSKRAGTRMIVTSQSMMSYLTESLIMIKPLKTMAREHLADAVMKRKTEKLKKIAKKLIYIKVSLSAFQEPSMVVFTALGLYFVLVVWKMSLASVLVLVYMFSKLMKRIQKVQSLYQQVVTAEAAYWSYKTKLERAVAEKETTSGIRQPTLRHSIQLKRVWFAYAKSWILKDAEFEFPKNSFTAIVGPSGVGKTTVVDLITGLLQPQEGEILIDGIPLSEIDLRLWRQMIGYVPQETLLLHDNVFINVTLGDKDYKIEDAEAALRAAGAWDFVQDLPQGIFTRVGERGYKLSGGQRQRIAIARALVHKPKLLILDEATTALDPENEAIICETLRKLKGELTILAISHQPAILDVAERAYRLEDRKAILIPELLTESTLELDGTATTFS
ncbi:MAG: ABC transporter ATP-binding protein [Desulfobacterales bacterium]|nr:ABC transporter ATP-binding protein [Desulfobacterales bacterium]